MQETTVKATLYLKKKKRQETDLESLFSICRSIFGLCLTDKARRRNIYGASQEEHINPQQHKEEVAISSSCNANANVKAFSSQLHNLKSHWQNVL